jgi:hypothetical protein
MRDYLSMERAESGDGLADGRPETPAPPDEAEYLAVSCEGFSPRISVEAGAFRPLNWTKRNAGFSPGLLMFLRGQMRNASDFENNKNFMHRIS